MQSLAAPLAPAATPCRLQRAASRRLLTTQRPQQIRWQHVARAEGDGSSEQVRGRVGGRALRCRCQPPLFCRCAVLFPRAAHCLGLSSSLSYTCTTRCLRAETGSTGGAAAALLAATAERGGACVGAARARAAAAEAGGRQQGPALWPLPPLLKLHRHCSGEKGFSVAARGGTTGRQLGWPRFCPKQTVLHWRSCL